jgi:16S rRNA G966 N2-methylase RsmD
MNIHKYFKYRTSYLSIRYTMDEGKYLINGGGFKKRVPLFPYKKNVDLRKIKLTAEGEYSYTHRDVGYKLIAFLNEKIGNLNKLTILDGTGNVGGDTIMFALNFNHVISIEINKDNYEALLHNIKLYDLNNVTVYNEDTTKFIHNVAHYDVLYLDPPWGGRDYKSKINLDLYLGTIRVDEFIKTVNESKFTPSYIVLKLPNNYNFSRLDDLYIKYEIMDFSVFKIALLFVR